MGVYFLCEIAIGGPISKEHLSELVKLLDHAGVLPDGPDLRKYLDKGRLFFRDTEASYGCFRNLEDFLQAHDIEFDRWSDGTYEYEPEMVTFRKGCKPRMWLTDRDGQRVVRACDVEQLMAHADIETTRQKWREILGTDVPRLRDIVAEELTLGMSSKDESPVREGK